NIAKLKFHVNEKNYSEFMDVLHTNNMRSMSIFGIKDDTRSTKTYDQVYISLRAFQNPYIKRLFGEKINVGKHIIELFYNQNPLLCYNEHCDCDRIHLIDNGIIRTIKHHRMMKHHSHEP